MVKIIITEKQEKYLLNYIILEQTQIQLVKDIEKFLNKNYIRGDQTEIDNKGNFTNKKVVGVKTKGDDGKEVIATNISPLDLYYKLEDVYKDKIDKGEKRKIFLKQVIMDWYNNSIKDGNLSKNLAI